MKMRCKKMLLHLNAYVDGELSGKRKGEVEAHLSACEACRDQVEQLLHIGEILDSLKVPPLPHRFAERVMAEARSREAVTIPEKKAFLLPGWLPLRWFDALSVPMRVAVCSAVFLACLFGVFMSREFALRGNLQQATLNTLELEGLEWFSPTPPASLGSAYFNLASALPEDRGAP
jgi:anti-sigma factor RsiW